MWRQSGRIPAFSQATSSRGPCNTDGSNPSPRSASTASWPRPSAGPSPLVELASHASQQLGT
ncbi:MAG: hypothetical protein ACRDRK_16075 [Pseudonocardia sp.]